MRAVVCNALLGQFVMYVACWFYITLGFMNFADDLSHATIFNMPGAPPPAQKSVTDLTPTLMTKHNTSNRRKEKYPGFYAGEPGSIPGEGASRLAFQLVMHVVVGGSLGTGREFRALISRRYGA